ncbi:hypothetical protein EIP86_008037 [Pleurotus ostreatoroseus]|nr:hypothetical protein EIP86_008037 [Pleurotus ostreatoroseus]
MENYKPDEFDDKSVEDSSESRGPTPMKLQKHLARITFFLTRWGVETSGIDPISPEDRTDPKLFQLFFVWFSANMNVLG